MNLSSPSSLPPPEGTTTPDRGAAAPAGLSAAVPAGAPSGLPDSVRAAGRWAALLGLSASVGAGLGHGLQQVLPVVPWAGAVVGAAVAALLAPALHWVLARPASRAPQAHSAGLGSALGPLPDKHRAARDALTGAYTQHHFVAATDREWSRIRRHGEDAALLMVDIDHFKALNDRCGMPCGDAVLVEATRQVAATLRQYDLLARFGGGVLVVYLPHTDPLGALDVAERIRERIAAIRLGWNSTQVRTTVSVGVAGIGASHGSLDEAIADAGTALREAKAAGRNCVRAAPIPPKRGVGVDLPLGDRRRAG